MQPGTTITPGQEENQPPTPPVVAVASPAPTPHPVNSQPKVEATSASEPEQHQPNSQQSPQAQHEQAVQPASPDAETKFEPSSDNHDGWKYTTDIGSSQTASTDYTAPHIQPVSWTASEFIDHGKDTSWFLGLGLLTVVVAGVLYIATHDVTTSVVIIVLGIIFGIAAARKPRTLQFQIDSQGVQIGTKLYPFGNFKSFAVMDEGAFSSIQLMPMQRFMPSISLYYPPEQEDSIINSLGSFLPHEDRQHDSIDNLMRRIRF